MKSIPVLRSFITCTLVCIFSTSVWAQVPPALQLAASTTNEDQDYGFSVDLDGDVAVVGAFRDENGMIVSERGAAFVYRFNGTTWTEDARLEASGANSFNWFGWDVAVSGDVLLATARNGDTFTLNGGDVSVFRDNGSIWIEETILTPADGIGGDFGFAIDIDGAVAAVGAPARAGTMASEGAVYVYRHNGIQWVEEDLLFGSDLSIQSLFGSAISIDGDQMLVSAFNAHDSTSNQAGKLYVFDYDGAQWNQTAELQSNQSNNIANLGISVALEGEWAVGGAPLDNDVQGGAGAALVYYYDGVNWNFHSKLTASDGQGFFLFGSSVALSGNQLLVTADGWAAPGEGSTGKAYLFEYNAANDMWEEMEGFVPAGATIGGSFGHAAAMQGEVILIGAPEYDGAQDEMGTAYIYGEPRVVTSNEEELPSNTLTMSDPFPNPFSNRASITITTDSDQPIHIAMYDILGREVKTLYEGRLPVGTPTSIEIRADDLKEGVYWIRVKTPIKSLSRSLTLIK